MTRILEYLDAASVDGKLVNRCRKCDHVLGAASGSFKEQAGRYDEPISVGQPLSFGEASETEWILRHFVCPGCGVLLEVDMQPKDEGSYSSVELGGGES
jgi:acetone carboxylase gamma subunit